MVTASSQKHLAPAYISRRLPFPSGLARFIYLAGVGVQHRLIVYTVMLNAIVKGTAYPPQATLKRAQRGQRYGRLTPYTVALQHISGLLYHANKKHCSTNYGLKIGAKSKGGKRRTRAVKRVKIIKTPTCCIQALARRAA